MAIFSGISLPTQLTLSYGVGRAAGAVLEPQLQGLVNSSWELITNEGVFVPPDPIFLAQGVAQGQIDEKTAKLWASYRGLGSNQFDALVNIANVGPGSAYAFELWRRNVIGETGFRRALNRLGWEQEWIDDAVQLKTIRLSAEQVAVMLQRSVIPNQGQLPGIKRAAQGKVPHFPEVPIDAYASAEAHGFTNDQVDALARIQGLPPGMDLVARMVYRKILDRSDFTLAAEQANRRVEWADFEFEGYRQIPTAEQFVEAHLRGWIDKQGMYDGTALHGMSKPNTDLEFQIHRRPLTPHQIKQALARGASFNPEAGEITNPYSASVHQNNLGPEWYELATSLAGSYPSVFVTNRLVDDQTITPEIGKTWREKAGDADEVVAALFKSWKAKATGGAVADPHVTKAENQLWTAQHSSYVKDRSDDAFATATLTELGVASGAIPTVLRLWQRERAIVKAGLSPAQIKKAYSEGTFTQPEAVARLVELQWSAADAGVYLGE